MGYHASGEGLAVILSIEIVIMVSIRVCPLVSPCMSVVSNGGSMVSHPNSSVDRRYEVLESCID